MIEELLIYQNADAKLRKIETKLSGSEARKKAVSAKKFLEGVEQNVDNLDARAAKLLDVYEKALDEQEKIREFQTEFESALKDAGNSSELSYLMKKADEVTVKIRALANKINKLAEEIQTVMKDYVAIKSNTKAAQAQYAENAKKYNDLKASYKDEKESAEKELEELKKKVDPALMERYLKKRAAKIYPVIYEVRENVCGACNMELPMSEINRLKNGEVIECSQCGRLLYRKK